MMFQRIVLAALLSATPALADSSVAEALGLKDSEIAAAVEDGAGRNLNHEAKAKDPTIRGMNAETSYFLRNAPTAAVRAEKKPVAVAPHRSQAEEERDSALKQLEFRRNVEDAMKRILAFSPVARPAPVETPEQKVERALTEDTMPVDSRDRLLRSAVKNNPWRPTDIPRGFQQGEIPRVESNQVDQRVVAPTRYEASADDDDGKPVRLGLSGDSSGADFPVISMRRGSHKASPGTVQTLPALRSDMNELPLNLKPLKGLFESSGHGGFGR